MMMQMVGAFAEFERAMIRERTSAGLAAARADGRIGGRRKKLGFETRMALAASAISGRKSDTETIGLGPTRSVSGDRRPAFSMQNSPPPVYRLNSFRFRLS